MVGYTTGFCRRKKKVEPYHGWIYFPGMAAKKKTSETRHGRLSEHTAQTSITMNKELLAKCRAAAKAEGRSLSNWLEQLARREEERKRTLPLYERLMDPVPDPRLNDEPAPQSTKPPRR